MLSTYRTNLVLLSAALLGSIFTATLLVWFLLPKRQSPDSLPGWQKGQRLRDLLHFVTGPFPLSIGLHLAILLFLMTQLIESTALAPMIVHLERSGGGGGGGDNPKLPEMPDVALADSAPPNFERPRQIILPHLAPLPKAAIDGNDSNPVGFGDGAGGGSGGGAGGGV